MTLICTCPPDPGDATVDPKALYGSDYWFTHQRESYGLGDIGQRSRSDLPERNTFWLNELLNLRLPPARVLEIGCAHGGFVHLMRSVGYDAAGLELSPQICHFATTTFDVPMLVGRLEDQKLERGSLDVIAMMDVLEHLPDPLDTLRRCADLLSPGGVMLIQTPCYPAPRSFGELAATGEKFLIHLNRLEHTYLFSRDSAARLCAAAGFGHVRFRPAIFPFYDMFFAASASPLPQVSPAARDAWLTSTPQRRLVAGLLDAQARFFDLLEKHRALRDWKLHGESAYAA
jgi:2-polyprenyl-3-methyl-5-hydroxy-6-metoxy-1,4-benzoquinol methylase